MVLVDPKLMRLRQIHASLCDEHKQLGFDSQIHCRVSSLD